VELCFFNQTIPVTFAVSDREAVQVAQRHPSKAATDYVMCKEKDSRFWSSSGPSLHRFCVLWLVLFSASILLAGCDSAGDNEAVSLGTVRAQVDSDAWQATDVTGQLLETSVAEGIGIFATSANPFSVIQLAVEDSDLTSRTYDVSSEANTAAYCGPETGTEGCASEVAQANSGEIVIENFDGETVRGRFKFETDRVTVTDGKFNVPVDGE